MELPNVMQQLFSHSGVGTEGQGEAPLWAGEPSGALEAEAGPPRGVVVEEVGPGSALERCRPCLEISSSPGGGWRDRRK